MNNLYNFFLVTRIDFFRGQLNSLLICDEVSTPLLLAAMAAHASSWKHPVYENYEVLLEE